MPKICQHDECTYNVFGGGFCQRHQYLRTDKKPKRINPVSAKRIAEKKEYSEIDVFNEIWQERPHISELSGKPLPYDKSNMKMWVCQFLHVLNKGRCPSMRLYKRNILLATPKEHEHQDQYPVFTHRKIELLREVYLKPSEQVD